MTATHDSPLPSPLSADQWAGLARLGVLVHEGEQALGHPATQSLVGFLCKLGDANERYALDDTLTEVLETLKALRESGVLRWIRENAGLVTETLALLRPFIPEILESLKSISAKELLEALKTLGTLLAKMHALEAFLGSETGEDLVSALRRAGDLWEETRADVTLAKTPRLLALAGDLVYVGRDSSLTPGPSESLCRGRGANPRRHAPPKRPEVSEASTAYYATPRSNEDSVCSPSCLPVSRRRVSSN